MFRDERGFTLVEMLVVLVIMALAIGLASAIVRPDERALLRIEADRLAQLLDLAANEARLTGQPIAWTADATGYRFWRRERDAGWSQIRDDDRLRARSLPHGMAISELLLGDMRRADAMRVEFDPYRPAPVFTVELTVGTARYAVTGDPIGEVRAVPGEGEASDAVAAR